MILARLSMFTFLVAAGQFILPPETVTGGIEASLTVETAEARVAAEAAEPRAHVAALLVPKTPARKSAMRGEPVSQSTPLPVAGEQAILEPAPAATAEVMSEPTPSNQRPVLEKRNRRPVQ